MFDNYREMSAEEKAQVKKIHKGIRNETASRSGNLAWGFVRGFSYRRIERTTRTQTMPDGTMVRHNAPNLVAVARIIVAHIPSLEVEWFAGKYQLKSTCPLTAWAASEDGAIPAPAPRPKRPYVRSEGNAA
jgi:hypothetical protein